MCFRGAGKCRYHSRAGLKAGGSVAGSMCFRGGVRVRGTGRGLQLDLWRRMHDTHHPNNIVSAIGTL